jgi:hypothetical protein
MTIMLSFPDVKGRHREAIAGELEAEGVPAPQPVEKNRPDPVDCAIAGPAISCRSARKYSPVIDG